MRDLLDLTLSLPLDLTQPLTGPETQSLTGPDAQRSSGPLTRPTTALEVAQQEEELL